MDEEFKDEYQEEYTRLVFLGKLISELTEPSSGKIDMESFSERCEFQMENNGDLLEIRRQQSGRGDSQVDGEERHNKGQGRQHQVEALAPGRPHVAFT